MALASTALIPLCHYMQARFLSVPFLEEGPYTGPELGYHCLVAIIPQPRKKHFLTMPQGKISKTKVRFNFELVLLRLGYVGSKRSKSMASSKLKALRNVAKRVMARAKPKTPKLRNSGSDPSKTPPRQIPGIFFTMCCRALLDVDSIL